MFYDHIRALFVITVTITLSIFVVSRTPSSLKFKSLYRQAASVIIGCFCAGLVLGAIYGLIPLFVMRENHDATVVANTMALIIFGGMFLQYSVGHISDYIERLTVLVFISALIIVISMAIIMPIKATFFLPISFFLFGGLTFTLYPLSISSACDHLDSKDIVAGTQGLLLAYSIGAMFGPLIAAIPMRVFGAKGLFLYFIFIATFMICFFLWRKSHRAPVPQDEPFLVMAQASPALSELDPRGEQTT